jgi:hypothetical protein
LSKRVEKRIEAEVLKVDEKLGLVFGWGIICKEGGEAYYDLQDDHIPEPLMLKAASDFMAHSRVMDDMHDWDDHGTVVHSMPMTEEIAKVYGLTIGNRTGWMVAVKPSADILGKFVDGTYTGFSIGGKCAREVVGDQA